MRKLICAAIGAALLLAIALGCGGQSGIPLGFLSQPAALTSADGQLSGHTYFDTWTFVPTKSGTAVFGMLSISLTSKMILKDSLGNTIQTVSTSGGSDDSGNFDGDVYMTVKLTGGETYTITATTVNTNEIGAYTMQWPDWVQLTAGGD